MTTRQDIQKPAPGAIIELFELDATAQGAASVYRFVNWANPLGGDVVWRGQTYTRYPVEAEGFELSGRGALPRPKLRVANATGLMGALAIELDDLLGARVTRWRTFVHYLDAANFPLAQQSTPGVLTFARSTTATYFSAAGVLSTAAVDQPRIDHDPATGAVRGLLVEEQRTNLLTQSQSIDSAAWLKTNTSTAADDTVAPDGTATADKVVSAVSNGVAYVQRGMTFTATNHTASFYVKAAGSSWCAIRIQNGSTNPEVRFKLTDGSASVSQGTAVAYGAVNVGSGWWRCWVTASCTATAGWSGVYVYSSTGQRVYTSSGETIYAWGAQCEAASDASSYIPTTTAAVTRAADYATVTDLSTMRFNTTSGALSVTARAPASLAQAATLLSYNDNTSSNAIRFRMEAGGALKAEIIAGGVTQASLSLGTLTAGAQFSAALSYAANDIRGCLNGGAVQSDTSASLPTVDRAMIGRDASGEWWNSTISRHRYWSRALTSTELQTITSGGAISDLPALDMDTSTGALEVYTLAPFNPTADPNQYLSRDVWVVDRKSSENRVFIEFELAAPIDVAGVMLPRRQVVANVCAWRYRSAECGYAGGPVADRDDNPTNNPALDACGKRLASCKLRFGQTGVLPYGGFPGTRRIG